MKKTLMAAAMAVCMWGGVALADDFSSTTSSSNTTNSDQTQQYKDLNQSQNGTWGGSGQAGMDETAKPETNVNVDVNTPAQTPVYAQPINQKDMNKHKESKANMRGLTMLLGGGVEGFTGSLAPRIAPGPAWDVNAAIKPSKVLGLELGYTGATHEIRGGEVSYGGADIVRNGGQAVATVGLTASPVQPYLLGGVGLSRFNVRGAAAGLQDDTVGNIPLGGGLRTHIGSFTADARMDYNMLFSNQFGGDIGATNRFGLSNGNAGTYLGTLNLGGTF